MTRNNKWVWTAGLLIVTICFVVWEPLLGMYSDDASQRSGLQSEAEVETLDKVMPQTYDRIENEYERWGLVRRQDEKTSASMAAKAMQGKGTLRIKVVNKQGIPAICVGSECFGLYAITHTKGAWKSYFTPMKTSRHTGTIKHLKRLVGDRLANVLEIASIDLHKVVLTAVDRNETYMLMTFETKLERFKPKKKHFKDK